VKAENNPQLIIKKDIEKICFLLEFVGKWGKDGR